MKGNEFEYFLDNLSLSTLLAKFSFAFLLLSMLFYWSQTSFKYTRETFLGKASSLTMWLANIALALMLSIRWIESGHFPLSNLYESLLFLSWSLTTIHFFLEHSFSNVLKTNGIDKTDHSFRLLSLFRKSQVINKRESHLSSPLTWSMTWFFTNKIGALMKKKQYNPHPQLGYQQKVCYDIVNHENNLKSPSVIQRNVLIEEQCTQPNEEDISPTLGAITAPLALFTNAFATFSLPEEMQKVTVLVPALQSNWLIMHVSVMMVSYAALLSGSLLAMAFLVINFIQDTPTSMQRFQLRSVNVKSSLHTPQLFTESDQKTIPQNEQLSENKLKQNLDNLSYRSIGLGFALLTIGIFSGAVWANEAWGSYWSWDPKETWAFVTWLVFALYLHTRLSRGWIGKKSALVATAGFLVIWFCYLGVNLFGKGLHSYGWFPSE